MALALGGLVPYADHHENGYHFASFVPSRPLLGHHFTVHVLRENEDSELFSFSVPMRHETVLSADPKDASLLDDAIKAVLALLPPAQQFDPASAQKRFDGADLGQGIELNWT